MVTRNADSSQPHQGDGGMTSNQPVAVDQQHSRSGNTVFKSGPLLISSKGIGWTSWKKRWFILTRTSLVFFRSDPNSLPQKGSEVNLTLGGIDLNSSGSVVVKADKKLLTVLFPDGRDGRAFTLKAETSEDLYEWKTALENALAQAPSGATPLENTLAQAPSAALSMGESGVCRDEGTVAIDGSFEQFRDRRPGNSLVDSRPVSLALEDHDGTPTFLEKALRFIEQYGVKVEGILRQAADVDEVERRIQEFGQGRNEFSPDEDAHVIADCVKYILRELPSCPIPALCCTSLLDAFKTTHGSRGDAMRAAISETFPEPNRRLLQRILKMMQTVASHKSENLMSTSAVAACMAPLLLRPLLAGDCEVEDDFHMGGDGSFQLLQAAAAANHAQAIVITLLEQFRDIFLEGSFSSESCSEGSGSEDEVSTDSEYHDEENDSDLETEYDYDAENDLDSETVDDRDEENGLDPVTENDHYEGNDSKKEDNPECKISGSPSASSGYEGSDIDDNKVSEGLVSESESPNVDKYFEVDDKRPTESHSISKLQSQSDTYYAMPNIESHELSEDVATSTSPVLRSRDLSLSSPILKSINKSDELMPNVKRQAIWGRTPARKDLSTESIDDPTEDKIAIQRLESTIVDLQNNIAKEAKENAVLQESLEIRKQALHERRLALEQDVTRLREQLQKERDLRATLEAVVNMPLGHLPISSTLDSKIKGEIEELALAEADVINLMQKAADLQVQLNQQRHDNHDSESCSPLHQEKIKDQQKDVEVIATKHHLERAPKSESPQNLQQLDLRSHISTTSMGTPTNSLIEAVNVTRQEAPSLSNQPRQTQQPDLTSNDSTKFTMATTSSSTVCENVKTQNPPSSSKKLQPRLARHKKTKSAGAITSLFMLTDSKKITSLFTDHENVATQDHLSLMNKQPPQKQQTILTSHNNTKSTGENTSSSTDSENVVTQNPTLSNKKPSLKKQMDSTSHNKAKSKRITASLYTDSQSVVTQDPPSLSNNQVPKKLQPELTSENSTKSTNAKTSSSIEETSRVGRKSSSKKTTGKGEGSGPSALTRLTNRLNFLKERRSQLANELKTLDTSSNPLPEHPLLGPPKRTNSG